MKRGNTFMAPRKINRGNIPNLNVSVPMNNILNIPQIVHEAEDEDNS